MTKAILDHAAKLRELARARYEARHRDPSQPKPPRKPRTPKPKRKIINQMIRKCRLMDAYHAKMYAKKIVRRMIEFGIIIRPNRCESDDCKAGGYPEIYHIEPKHPADVTFLCRKCRCVREKVIADKYHVMRCGPLKLKDTDPTTPRPRDPTTPSHPDTRSTPG